MIAMRGVPLSQDCVARRAIVLWKSAPQHHTVVAAVCQREMAIPPTGSMRPPHRHRRDLAARVLVARKEVVLAQHQIGWLAGF